VNLPWKLWEYNGRVSRVPFSSRYQVGIPAGGLILDDLPPRVADGIVNVLESLESYWPDVVQRICLETDATRPVLGTPLPTAEVARILLHSLPWYAVCDACEGLYEFELERKADLEEQGYDEVTDWASLLERRLNQVFARNHFGYELRDGQIERVGALSHDAAIEQARGILRDPDLNGPNEQFEKAIRFYNARPVPDCANAVKDAVGAVEGLARILFGDNSLVLSEACQRLRDQKGLHGALAGLLEKLYGYRGDADGSAHGATGERPVPLEEAEFVIGVSASAIIYLARVFGRATR
jgi:hypothetical protein